MFAVLGLLIFFKKKIDRAVEQDMFSPSKVHGVGSSFVQGVFSPSESNFD
jgi:hypothetical protein